MNNATSSSTSFDGYLGGVRVLEIGDELSEYCGKVLAGLGAEVVLVEPPGGSVTRAIGPFFQDDPDPEKSLHFWHYQLGKRSIAIDFDDPDSVERLRRLVEVADVVIDSTPRERLPSIGLGPQDMLALNPRLVHARITPFGDDGPWANFQASDLVHLALGGVMMNCGYDPDPFGNYDTPPVAPQMWQSYHITGELAALSVVGAITSRLDSGRGQLLSTSVHQAVSQNTETDIPDWVYLRQVHRRLTCRHSTTTSRSPSLSITKDGRYILPYRTYVRSQLDEWEGTVDLLKEYGMQGDLDDPRYDGELRDTPEARDRLAVATDRLIERLLFQADIWRKGQDRGLPWTPLRRPEENTEDDHWHQRGTFARIEHPELDRVFLYTGAKWVCDQVEWKNGPRAPFIGEHDELVDRSWTTPVEHERVHETSRPSTVPTTSARGEAFPLKNVRVLDMSWMLASAGAGRFLAAMGAEVIKVENIARPDRMRFSPLGLCPPGGREERDRADGPIDTPELTENPDRGGSFMEINSGKLGISLDAKNESGRKLLEDLIRESDMIVEGFSPGTMIRMGFGYERLRELNPSIIYVQQSGLGERGLYGRARTYGPSAQAITGISEMSGLPEPFPPAGIGYSYLDWFGAYNMALAMVSALYRRNVTGEGCHIDASQADTGIFLTGTAILDYTANGRRWRRYGNRSPYKPAAPHGAYRTEGSDRWIALSVFDDEQWAGLADVLGHPEWLEDERFVGLAARMEHQDELDDLVGAATLGHDPFTLMTALQQRGVPAGVCQTAEDRVEADPQLEFLEWLVELDQSEIGRWPVKEHPTLFSETPTYIGGPFNRSGPSYGEDTDDVLTRVLGLSGEEIARLRDSGALA